MENANLSENDELENDLKFEANRDFKIICNALTGILSASTKIDFLERFRPVLITLDTHQMLSSCISLCHLWHEVHRDYCGGISNEI
jgi:hypothetical protein